MAMKAGIKTIEAAIATFLILSFVILVFNTPSYEFSSAQKEFVENLLREAFLSTYLKEELVTGNITKIKNALEEVIPFDFEIGLEEINISVFSCEKNACTFYFNVNKSLINASFLSFFSNETQETNITINSQTVFSGKEKEYHHIDVLEYLQNSNELKVEKSSENEIFIVLYFMKEIIPEKETDEVVAYPCYAEGVKKLYVFL